MRRYADAAALERDIVSSSIPRMAGEPSPCSRREGRSKEAKIWLSDLSVAVNFGYSARQLGKIFGDGLMSRWSFPAS